MVKTPKKGAKPDVQTDRTRTLKQAESVLSPFTTWVEPEETNNTNYYITLTVILLPSFLAVLVPAFPNSPSSTDIAVLVTDTLIVLLVAWVVKFCIEWPWNWLHEVKNSKANLINRTNSVLLTNPERDIDGDDDGIVASVLLVKRLVRFEWCVMGCCFLGVLISALIMLWTRSYVIVEDTRRSIVFSNVNIGVFVLWSSFRIFSAALETLRRSSLVSSEIEANEYNLINEANLDNFIKADTSSDVSEAVQGFVSCIRSIFISGSSKEKQLVRVIETQQAQLDEMSVKVQQLTTTIESLGKKINEAKTNFRPFPLNLEEKRMTMSDTTSKFEPDAQSTLKAKEKSVGEQLSTIFEEPEAHGAPISLPKETISGPRVKSRKPENNMLEDHYSLHGLPFSSRIRSLITRRTGYDATEEVIPDYTSDHKLSEVGPQKEEITNQSMLKDLKGLWQQLTVNFDLKEFAEDPGPVLSQMIRNIKVFVSNHDKRSLMILLRPALVKVVVRELINKHVTKNLKTLRNYLISLCYLLGQRTSKVVKASLVMPLRWSESMVVLGLKVLFFIPRKIAKVLSGVTSWNISRRQPSPRAPIVMTKATKNGSNRVFHDSGVSVHLSSDSVGFKGMRQFKLNNGVR